MKKINNRYQHRVHSIKTAAAVHSAFRAKSVCSAMSYTSFKYTFGALINPSHRGSPKNGLVRLSTEAQVLILVIPSERSYNASASTCYLTSIKHRRLYSGDGVDGPIRFDPVLRHLTSQCCCCPLGFDGCDNLLRFVGHRAEMVDIMDGLPAMPRGSALLLMCFCSSTR